MVWPRLATLLTGVLICRDEDKNKVTLAVGCRRIDPADVLESAKATTVMAPGLSQRKRKATFETAMSSSQAGPSSSQISLSSSQPSGSSQSRNLSTQRQEVIEIEDDDPAEESVDELYVSLRSQIVGIQYYKGGVGWTSILIFGNSYLHIRACGTWRRSTIDQRTP